MKACQFCKFPLGPREIQGMCDAPMARMYRADIQARHARNVNLAFVWRREGVV